MTLTRDQLQTRKEEAVRFTRDVLDDPDRAEEIEEESLEAYADRRHITLTNSSKRRNRSMARGKTKADLEQEVADLQEENQELQDQLDTIADIVTSDDDDTCVRAGEKRRHSGRRETEPMTPVHEPC